MGTHCWLESDPATVNGPVRFDPENEKRPSAWHSRAQRVDALLGIDEGARTRQAATELQFRAAGHETASTSAC